MTKMRRAAVKNFVLEGAIVFAQAALPVATGIPEGHQQRK
jgi:hypothetical protein